jgi:hypothetical protein
VKQDFRNGSSTEKEKATTADEVQGNIYNYTFTLSLSCLVDIYSIYSALTNILQIINILPFDKMDSFNNRLNDYSNMLMSISMDSCPCSMFVDCEDNYKVDETVGSDGKEFVCKGILDEVCEWPTYHKDVREVLGKATYRGAVMGMAREEGNRTRAGNMFTEEFVRVDRSDVIETVNKRATEVVSFLLVGLKEKVYSNKDVIIINNLRTVLDLKIIMKKIKIFGSCRVSDLGWRNFCDIAVFFEQGMLVRIGEDELRTQYREFNRRLEQISSEKRSDLMTSMEIIARFLDPKQGQVQCTSLAQNTTQLKLQLWLSMRDTILLSL